MPLTATSTFISAFTQKQNFIAELNSEMVVLSVPNDATGTAYFQPDMESDKIKYNLTATDLGSVKATHINIGKEGEDGQVIVAVLSFIFNLTR